MPPKYELLSIEENTPQLPAGRYSLVSVEDTEQEMKPVSNLIKGFTSVPKSVPSMLSSAYNAVTDLPSNISYSAQALQSALGYGKGRDPAFQQAAKEAILDTTEGATRFVGKSSGMAGGALAGAQAGLPLAPFTFGAAPVITGAIGGALGGGAFDFLNEITGSDKERTPEQRVNEAAFNIGAGLFTPAATGISRVSRATGNTGLAVKDAFSQAGAKKIASEIYSKVGGKELVKQIDDVIENKLPADKFGQYKTTGQMTENPGILSLESGLARNNPEIAAVLDAKTLARNAQREEMLSNLRSGATLSDEIAGSTLRDALSKKAAAAKEGASKLFHAVDEYAGIGTVRAKYEIVDAYKRLFPDKSIPVPSEAKALLRAVKKQKMSSPVKNMQAIQSYAKEIQRNMPETRAAKFAGDVTRSIDDALERADELVPLQEARTAYRNYKETYSKGTAGDILRKKQGDYALQDSNVIEKVLKTPEGAREVVTKLGKKNPALKDLREKVLEQFAEKKLVTGQLSPSGFNKLLKNKEDVFKEILEPKHLDDLKVIGKDLANESKTMSLASLSSKGGSNTAQNLSTSQYIRDRILDNLGVFRPVGEKVFSPTGAVTVGGASGGVVGSLIGITTERAGKALLNRATNAVNAALLKAASDPAFARELAKGVTKGRAAQIVEEIMPQVGKNLEALKVIPQAGVGAAESIGLFSEKPSFSDAYDLEQERKAKQEEERKAKQSIAEGLFSKKGEPVNKKLEAQEALADPLVQALIQTESAGNPKAVSPVGAKGLMQLMDKTGQALAKQRGVDYDPFDAEQNIALGTMELNSLRKKYNDDRLALAAYNWGQGNLDKLIKKVGSKEYSDLESYLPEETQNHNLRTFKNLEKILKA